MKEVIKDNLNIEHLKVDEELPSITELHEKTWKIYRNGFFKFLGLALLPLLATSFFLVITLIMTGTTLMFGLEEVYIILGVVIVSFTCIVVVYISLVSRSAVYLLIKNFSKGLNLKESFVLGKKYVWSIFYIEMLVFSFIVLFGIFFIIPGFIMYIFYSLAVWARIYEGFRGTSALARSKELIKHYWWPVFIRYFVIYIIYIIPVGIIDYLFKGYEYSLLNTIWSLVNSFLNIIITQYFLIYSCYIYWALVKIKGKDSKIHKNGNNIFGIFAIILVIIILVLFFIGTYKLIPKQ